jgi:hypothetical protein
VHPKSTITFRSNRSSFPHSASDLVSDSFSPVNLIAVIEMGCISTGSPGFKIGSTSSAVPQSIRYTRSHHILQASCHNQFQQHGAEVARGAHNPEVTGSRPVAAIRLRGIFFLIVFFGQACKRSSSACHWLKFSWHQSTINTCQTNNIVISLFLSHFPIAYAVNFRTQSRGPHFILLHHPHAPALLSPSCREQHPQQRPPGSHPS